MWTLELGPATVAFTDRTGGVSEPPYGSLNLGANTGDADDSVGRNLELLRVGLGLERIDSCNQVHGATIVPSQLEANGLRPDADGLYTSQPREGVMVTVADCLPVALAGDDKVMVLHCGWRGLAAGIIEAGVAEFAGVSPLAAVGPGIGADAYAVGTEVVEALDAARQSRVTEGQILVDLRAVALARLRAAGVQSIESVDVCTYSSPNLLFSHRRDAETGRQAGLAWLR